MAREKPKRRKRMTSILPESLSVIEECSEESDSTASMPFERGGGSSMTNRSPVGALHKQLSNSSIGSSVSHTKGMMVIRDNHHPVTTASIHDEDNNSKGRARSIAVSAGSADGDVTDADENAINGVPPHNSSSNKRGNTTEGKSGSKHKKQTDDPSDATAQTVDTSNSSNESGHRKGKGTKGHDTGIRSNHSTVLVLPSSSSPPSSPRKLSYDECDNDESFSVNDGFSVSESVSIIHDGHVDVGSDEGILKWRLDPVESLSDWSIKVRDRDSKNIEIYHVHKSTLAVGPRKSEYFVNIFGHKNPRSSQRTVTDVILPATAAKTMPELLDFIYSVRPAKIKSDTAIGMRFLSQFFGVKPLFKHVMNFIQKDLSLATLEFYIRDSTSLQDEKMLGISSRHVARNIAKIDVRHRIAGVMDFGFLERVLQASVSLSVERRRHFSIFVASFCRKNIERLDQDTFLRLTTEEYLPTIHQTAALPLLDLEADVVTPTSLESLRQMTNLQRRCVHSLGGYWKELSEVDPVETSRVCRKLPSFVVAELLTRSLTSALADNARDKRESVHDKSRQANERNPGHNHFKSGNGKASVVSTRLESSLDQNELDGSSSNNHRESSRDRRGSGHERKGSGHGRSESDERKGSGHGRSESDERKGSGHDRHHVDERKFSSGDRRGPRHEQNDDDRRKASSSDRRGSTHERIEDDKCKSSSSDKRGSTHERSEDDKHKASSSDKRGSTHERSDGDKRKGSSNDRRGSSHDRKGSGHDRNVDGERVVSVNDSMGSGHERKYSGRERSDAGERKSSKSDRGESGHERKSSSRERNVGDERDASGSDRRGSGHERKSSGHDRKASEDRGSSSSDRRGSGHGRQGYVQDRDETVQNRTDATRRGRSSGQHDRSRSDSPQRSVGRSRSDSPQRLVVSAFDNSLDRGIGKASGNTDLSKKSNSFKLRRDDKLQDFERTSGDSIKADRKGEAAVIVEPTGRSLRLSLDSNPGRTSRKNSEDQSVKSMQEVDRKHGLPRRLSQSGVAKSDFSPSLQKELFAGVKKEYEEKLNMLRDLCLEKDAEIARYRREVEKFIRLPNNYDGRLLTSGIINGQAGKLPRVLSCEKDGYLLAMRKGPKYALFYYKYDDD